MSRNSQDSHHNHSHDELESCEFDFQNLERKLRDNTKIENVDLKPLAERLISTMPLRNHSGSGFSLKSYKMSFTGKELLDWIVRITNSSRENAKTLGQNLADFKFLHDVKNSSQTKISDSPKSIYQFEWTPHHTAHSHERDEEFLSDVALQIGFHVSAQDRMYRLVTYKSCMVASEIVDFLSSSIKGVCNRTEAVELCNLMTSKGYLVHVTESKRGFQDDFLFYRLVLKDDKSPSVEVEKKKEFSIKNILNMSGNNSNSSSGSFTEENRDEMTKSRNRTLRSSKSMVPQLPTSDDAIRLLAFRMYRALDIRDRTYHLKTYNDCFVSMEAINWLTVQFYISRPVACDFLTNLIKKGYIYHTARKLITFPDSLAFFSFTELGTPAQVKTNNNNDSETSNLLFTAISEQNLEAVKQIVAAGSDDVNECDEYRFYPLHMACTIDSTLADEIFLNLLMHPKIDLEVRNEDKNTPLHYFCQKWSSPMIAEQAFEIFLKKGADVNSRNANGETCLHKAVFNSKLRILLLNFLISAGADINAKNLYEESALHYSIHLRRSDIAYLLVKAGANTKAPKNQEGLTPYALAAHPQKGCPEIYKLFNRVADLQEWLVSVNLANVYKTFLQQGIFVHRLGVLNDETLATPAFGITDPQLRSQILQEAEKLQGKNFFNSEYDIDYGREETKSALHKTLTASLASGSQNRDWVLRASETEFVKRLAEGTSGTVFKGYLNGEVVAIKTLKAEKVQQVELEEFKKEFQIMALFNSPYLVYFFGATLEPRLTMVLEFCGHGSLYDVLNEPNFQPSWALLIKMYCQAMKGVETLHKSKPQVVHRDLKSLNLMVTDSYQVKVGDFGLSRFNTQDNQETLKKTVGTYHYLAPEIWDKQGAESSYSTKADVYSMGIVLWEMVNFKTTGSYLKPYGEFPHLRQDFQVINQVSKNKIRPTIPEETPRELAELIRNIWLQEPENRPEASQVIAALAQIGPKVVQTHDKSSTDSLNLTEMLSDQIPNCSNTDNEDPLEKLE